MKYKNYKSAIHNFAHSFMSIDYMKSGRLAINVLIDLHNNGFETKADFDFINKTIEPKAADSKESRQLLSDYLDWLPDHFDKHNCDLKKLERLDIIIKTDFNNTIPYERNQKDRVFQIKSLVTWKADGRNEEYMEISQSEVIPKKLIDFDKIPRFGEMN